jgi:hypothetical protein
VASIKSRIQIESAGFLERTHDDKAFSAFSLLLSQRKPWNGRPNGLGWGAVAMTIMASLVVQCDKQWLLLVAGCLALLGMVVVDWVLIS